MVACPKATRIVAAPIPSCFFPYRCELVKYGELVILGYNGCLPQGDKGRCSSYNYLVSLQVWASEVRRAGNPWVQRLPAPGRQGSSSLQICPLPTLQTEWCLKIQTLCRQDATDQSGNTGIGQSRSSSVFGHTYMIFAWIFKMSRDFQRSKVNTSIRCRDAPDTVLAGYPAGWISGQSKNRIPDIRISGKAGYRISGRIIVLTKRFIVKYQLTTTRKAKITNVSFSNFEHSNFLLLSKSLCEDTHRCFLLVSMNSFENITNLVSHQMGWPWSCSSIRRPNKKDILSSLIEEVIGDFSLNLDPFLRVSRQAGGIYRSLAAIPIKKTF
jgi:hypothetical protein